MMLASIGDLPLVAQVMLVAGLILFTGFFVGAELALIRVRATQLDPFIAKGNRRALAARHIVENVELYLGATQLGITLAGLGMGAVAEPIFSEVLSPLFKLTGVHSEKVQGAVALGFGFFVNSYLLIVVGELAPKAIAIRYSLIVALWTAQPLIWFYRLTSTCSGCSKPCIAPQWE